MGALINRVEKLKSTPWPIGFLMLLVLTGCGRARKPEADLIKHPALGSAIESFVSSLHVDSINGIYPEASVTIISPGLAKVTLKFQLKDSVCQDDWKVTIKPSFKPTFYWSPHLVA